MNQITPKEKMKRKLKKIEVQLDGRVCWMRREMEMAM